MRFTRALVTIAVAAVFFVGCDENDPTGPDRTAEAFDWTGAVAQGERIEIKNTNGDVRASFTSGSEVVVHATKTGGESDPASVAIEVVRHEAGVTICAVYPDVPGHAPNECLPGLQGNMTNRDNDVMVEFTVGVPAGVNFVGRVVNGDVDADGLQSDVSVIAVNGNVSVATAGIADVSSVHGSLHVIIGRADPGRDLAFRTASGNVTVRVPSNVNAEVLALTTSGTVSSDFRLEGTATRRFGTLGSGGPNLRLSTVSGNVGLRKGPAVQP